ncbi:putative membrane protein YeiB [Scopulibacillus daqui]|uniref:Membrane protein YeiB n=1 Tax=Scopulibacillus daqui TaxID=1469162 RepID=A0ABS2Q325_9BACL|nr:DUF418 domain-containing protein [Scopulibacillus daqui]MBM7646616.1 putative membrane protein YeiB [Scopulibacillus daqui]
MKQRIDTLDFLRGFALLGIILINIGQIVPYLSNKQSDYFIGLFLNYAVYEHFFVIFSFLFGIGFYIFITRAKNRGDNSTILFIRRLTVLLIIGLIHHQFQPGEALLPYAIFGFILIPFYRLKPIINFVIAVILLVLFLLIGGGILMILPMFLLGLCTGQWKIFENLSVYEKGVRAVQLIFLCLTPFAIYAQYILLEKYGQVDLGSAVSGIVMSTLYVTTLTLLLRHNAVQKLLSPLKYIGRMALTNYLVQTMLILAANALFHLQGQAHLSTLMFIAISILIIQMIYSTIWFKYFKIGPIEYIWRILTYGKLPDRYKKAS